MAVLPLILAFLALLASSAFASPFELPASRTGVKQGPLLLIDDIVAASQTFLAGGPPPVHPLASSDLAAGLSTMAPPGTEAGALPTPPPTVAGFITFLPPFLSGCCTTKGGSGQARVEDGDDRGAFEMNLAVEGGEHAFSVASPCSDFRSPVTGVARCAMALVVHGAARGAEGEAGEGLVALGPWIAHCHPRDQGSYSQKMTQSVRGVAGRLAWEGVVVRHYAEFPVTAGVDYKFGAGLWAACAASGDAAMALRLWGRLAYLTVQCVARP